MKPVQRRRGYSSYWSYLDGSKEVNVLLVYCCFECIVLRGRMHAFQSLIYPSSGQQGSFSPSQKRNKAIIRRRNENTPVNSYSYSRSWRARWFFVLHEARLICRRRNVVRSKTGSAHSTPVFFGSPGPKHKKYQPLLWSTITVLEFLLYLVERRVR